VVDVALQEGAMVAVEAGTRARVLDRLRLGDLAFRQVTRAAAVAVLLLLSGVIVALIQGSLPALQAFGFEFLMSDRWNPVTEKFGALAPVYGTLITSFIAMLIAVPLGNVPGIAPLFAGPPYGIGMLTAGLILAIMVLPFVTSISRDVFEAVPAVLKEAAYGVGCTTWEVARNIVLPYARVGVIGGVMLALGRALGETMAVTFVIGNAHRISASLLAPGTTISATIANEFTEALGDLYTSSLIALGLILFVITFIVLAAARYMLLRIERRIG
jgi:phosphate transport system permease protein